MSGPRKLDELRAKIDQILARPAPTPPPPSDPARGELPFVLHETEHGPLYRRIVRGSATHRVGRFSVLDAWDADAAMLALLALDPSLSSLDPRSFLYLDTESTGPARGERATLFLLGMARFEQDERGRSLVLEQLILRKPGEEAPMLERFVSEAERASCLVSYNGKAFDLPLLGRALAARGLPPPPPRPHLDLVHLARRIHRDRLGPCRLSHVEAKVLGFGRVVDAPSGEVTARYRQFLHSGDEAALLGVVEHNAQDVLALAALVGIYGAPRVALPARDLVGVARALRRSRALDEADLAADDAVAKGAGAAALKERALVARARGERDRAVADLEQALACVDDPEARLVLAKLYEHHVRAPAAALKLVEQGTSEDSADSERRAKRLQRKVERQGEPKAKKPRKKASKAGAARATKGKGPDR